MGRYIIFIRNKCWNPQEMRKKTITRNKPHFTFQCFICSFSKIFHRCYFCQYITPKSGSRRVLSHYAHPNNICTNQTALYTYATQHQHYIAIIHRLVLFLKAKRLCLRSNKVLCGFRALQSFPEAAFSLNKSFKTYQFLTHLGNFCPFFFLPCRLERKQNLVQQKSFRSFIKAISTRD